VRSGHPAVMAEGLAKRYGDTLALDGLDLEIAAGSVLGLLGPNGAGKTTAVRILATLVRPDAGRAVVLGLDVVRHPEQVRQVIGLSGQYAAVDANLTGRENLEMIARLSRLGRKPARARARELIERFGLADARDRLLRTYSGGMRRRLDLAAALVASPRVLILDEPTTGLDPRARIGLWDVIGHLVRDGTTVLLTTQYLEEADRLAGFLVIVDHGRVIARGTPAELKARLGGDRVEIAVADHAQLPAAIAALSAAGASEPQADPGQGLITVDAPDGARRVASVLAALDRSGVHVADIALRRPTLDEVFLTLTGHPGADAHPAGGDTARAAARSGRHQ
jgi:ABC-2 type transport system ATP-binding protein